MAQGSIRVSFAGTFAEAVEYAKEHEGITAPKGMATKGDDDGLPMLSAVYSNEAERVAKRELLTKLGWDPEFQWDKPHGSGY